MRHVSPAQRRLHRPAPVLRAYGSGRKRMAEVSEWRVSYARGKGTCGSFPGSVCALRIVRRADSDAVTNDSRDRDCGCRMDGLHGIKGRLTPNPSPWVIYRKTASCAYSQRRIT